MYIVHWEINGYAGHGEPVAEHIAYAWMKKNNKIYGLSSHWVVFYTKK